MTTWQDGIEYTLIETPRKDFGIEYTHLAKPVNKVLLPELDPRLQELSLKVWALEAKVSYLEGMLESTIELIIQIKEATNMNAQVFGSGDYKEEFIDYKIKYHNERMVVMIDIFTEFGNLTGDKIRELEEMFFKLIYECKDKT